MSKWLPLLALVVVAVVITCGPPKELPQPAPIPTPSGAEVPATFCPGCMQFEPPLFYARWWGNIEQCSGFTGKLSLVRWYLAPKPYLRVVDNGDSVVVGAYLRRESPTIVLGLFREADSTIVQHEMLHALLDQNDAPRDDRGHPSEERIKCGALIGNW